MIRLNIVLAALPFLFLFSCSSDDESTPSSDQLDPVAAECKLAEDRFTQVVDSLGQKTLTTILSKSYGYDNDLMSTYTNTTTINYVDKADEDNSISQSSSYTLDLSYDDNGMLLAVSYEDEPIAEVNNVDNRVHSVIVNYTDGSYGEFEFSYDDQGRIFEIEDTQTESDSTLIIRLDYNSMGLSAMNFYYGDFKYFGLDYTFSEQVRNPYQGFAFYIISIIENQGSAINSDFTNFGEYLVTEIIYGEATNMEGGWDRDVVYTDQMTYQLNDKNYPITGTVPDQTEGDIVTSINQDFNYTNCD
ncbi:hypothetical protein [Flammeovirga kamogawensis]|uniref:DUF4595 domain-containing protein n=1 Tax=Flammeovirga kamogawensis TaxID=373891 RepID=A0ABX8GWI7_9BACT|nr:hypothetical protein [Flammeovirga kamogawensis]MBB6460538.1 hypothetical protein [Flammeovirga kamogawensis]QWG07901.1 hypothetical protein KM029_02885 [Flammeovirga kamogawensis]TRX69707.1 hypothetical protein EO216_16815 [Flammeovirga kamogawensis]